MLTSSLFESVTWFYIYSLLLLVLLLLNTLLWFCRHCLLCIYGAIALALIIAGRLKELRVVYTLMVFWCALAVTDNQKKNTVVALINGFLVFTVAVELIQHSITSDGVSCHSFAIVG